METRSSEMDSVANRSYAAFLHSSIALSLLAIYVQIQSHPILVIVCLLSTIVLPPIKTRMQDTISSPKK